MFSGGTRGPGPPALFITPLPGYHAPMLLRQRFGPLSFYRTALSIALPVMIQQLIMSMVSLIDNFMVAGLGDVSMAAVNVSNIVGKSHGLILSVLIRLCHREQPNGVIACAAGLPPQFCLTPSRRWLRIHQPRKTGKTIRRR